MKTISIALASHIAQPTTTLARLWEITRRDGTKFHFTDHDLDILYGGDTYEALTGFSSSDIETSGQLNVDDLEVTTFFDAASITQVDVEAGKWDGATIRLMVVNYADLTQGALLQRFGELGQFSYDGQRFRAELRGLMQYLANNIGRTYGANCPYQLGDADCKVDLDDSNGLTQEFEVTAVASRIEFTADVIEADNFFRYGIVEWLTGDNAGYRMEVRASTSGGGVSLQLQMPFEIQVGDTGKIIAGCDKTEATCIAKFANILNFGGFPDIPGMDRMLNSGTE